MKSSVSMRCLQAALAALVVCGASSIGAQPQFGNPSPTAGSDTSQRANASADQALYKPVEYMNASKKGPALIVIPGEIKSSNATFLQKFTSNNIADFAEVELSSANFQVLERSNLGPILKEFELAYNLGDPQAARKFLGMGKLKTTKYVVKFDILKAEQIAQAQQGFDGRTLGQMAGRSRLRAHGRIERCLDHRHALQDHQRGNDRAARAGLYRGEDGSRREIVVGARRFAVAARWRIARHDGAAARPEIRVGNRQQVQVSPTA